MAKNPRLIDLTGASFSRWTVLSKAGNGPRGGALWLCRCQCGAERPVMGADLRAGKSVSCGCARTERISRLNKTHGRSNTRLHVIWKNMRSRCLNPNRPGFEDYGGRGITICSEWSDYLTFEKWALVSGYKDDLSIDRLDVNGNYEPKNCIWASPQAQSENRRFVAKAPNGKLWLHIARENGISDAAYRTRIFAGWHYHQASTWPMRKKRNGALRDESGRFK